MQKNVINLASKFNLFKDRWSPRVIAELNDYQFKLAKLEGEFVWHEHHDTDEAFIVLDGELEIEFRDGVAKLGPGEMIVVPKGVEHKPIAKSCCQVMLLEPRGVVNTGESDSELTANNDVWI